MPLSSTVLAAWLEHILVSYYLIRPLKNPVLRGLLVFTPCLVLTLITCRHLPAFYGSTMFILAISWLLSIRLIHLTLFSGRKALSLQTFLSRILWIVFPFRSDRSALPVWPIAAQLVLFVVKLFVHHWLYQWLMSCGDGISYGRIVLFFGSMMTVSYLFDGEAVALRLVTREKYFMESFTNFPILSCSLREFWGRRYNRFVSTILKESIFEPIRAEWSAPTTAGLLTFIVSGLLHAHLAWVLFNDIPAAFSALIYFILHGLVCCLEVHVKIRLPVVIRWMLTQGFLLVTAPMMLRPFLEKGSPFLALNPPPFLHSNWLPKLPIASFCSK